MPAKKSTHLKVLEGDIHTERHKAEPKPKRKPTLKPPTHLSARAKRLWRVKAKELDDAWILTRLDYDQLADICAAEDQLLDLRKARDEEGAFIDRYAANGKVIGKKVNPLVRLVSDLENRLRMMRNDFGMTPKARTSLHVEPEDNDDEIEQYFTK